MTNPILSNLSRIKITVLLFGRESELTCTFKNYIRPYLEVETPQGTRIFHESIVKEIIPLEKTNKIDQLRQDLDKLYAETWLKKKEQNQQTT